MASLILIEGTNSFSWIINGLSSSFNSTNYLRAGISTSSFQNGASSISNIFDFETAGNYSATSTSINIVNCAPKTYTFYGFAQAKNGLYYTAGSATVTVKDTKPKPTNFYWNNVYSGANMISASEWNRFTNKINEWNEYKNRSQYSFTRAYSGDKFYAYMFNEASNQIYSMKTHNVGRKYSGDTIYARDFLDLENALNNIS